MGIVGVFFAWKLNSGFKTYRICIWIWYAMSTFFDNMVAFIFCHGTWGKKDLWHSDEWCFWFPTLLLLKHCISDSASPFFTRKLLSNPKAIFSLQAGLQIREGLSEILSLPHRQLLEIHPLWVFISYMWKTQNEHVGVRLKSNTSIKFCKPVLGAFFFYTKLRASHWTLCKQIDTHNFFIDIFSCIHSNSLY